MHATMKNNIKLNTLKTGDDPRQSINSSDDCGVVTERRYGCYKLGAIIAGALIILLFVGIVPVLFAVDSSKIILLVTCIMLSIVAILLFLSFGWQRKQVKEQREKFGREWVKTTKRQNKQYKSIPTSSHTSWKFWNTSVKDDGDLGTPVANGMKHQPTHTIADDALKAELTEYTKSCAEKTNFSEEGIKKLHAKDLSLTENVQCFQKCFFESSGIVNENGLNGDRLFEIATAFEKDVSKTKANFQKCSALYKADTTRVIEYYSFSNIFPFSPIVIVGYCDRIIQYYMCIHNMKTTIIFVIVAATVVVCKGTLRQFQQQVNSESFFCGARHNINPREVQMYFQSPTSNATENMKCFAKCLFERIGFVDSKGMVNDNLIKENRYPDELIPSIEKCKPKTPMNNCEISFNVFNCLIKDGIKNNV
ncbi:hypothetical protein Bhyg_04194 [Pseudolycoriella hygida]|uniref:Uncharacterized protein n=1 Tax=Pseudolycoriella hygida TaxID=35572 RepID=A0A9Q0NET7_9DIPT|nr:hypothetical protein Bhyg_04194 [Pseudolycoriella hygida]